MQNSGIFLRKMIEIVAEGDTFILHFAFFILHFYRAIGSINWNLKYWQKTQKQFAGFVKIVKILRAYCMKKPFVL